MIGQGSPCSLFRYLSVGRPWKVVLIVVVWLSFFAPATSEDLPHLQQPTNSSTPSVSSLRFRMSWGGGEARQWAGTLSVTHGSITDLAILGLTADASGSAMLQGSNQVSISHWSAVDYGGVDVSVSAAPDAMLNIVLFPTNDPESRYEESIEISKLINNTFSDELDEVSNRFSIARVPGDRLRVDFDRDHLVFSPGETFLVKFQGNQTGWSPRRCNCRLKMSPGSKSGNVARWSKNINVQIDRKGSSQEHSVEVPIPSQEGVYQLEMELDSAWHPSSVHGRGRITRAIQFVVIDPAPPTSNDEWSLDQTVDSVSGRSQSKFSFGQLPRFPNPTRKLLGNAQRQTLQVAGESKLELLPGGWQAVPLVISESDQPCLIEVEVAADTPVAVGFSLLQPDAKDQVPLYGFDSGMFFPGRLEATSPEDQEDVVRHQIVCWPRTTTPYLLIANRSEKHSAVIGDIHVYNSSGRLPQSDHVAARGSTKRQFMAFYESPLFAENFGTLGSLDPNLDQTFDDWRMFYEGADRFVQYLKANHYQGAFVTVACDGSSIYPSHHLNPSPKHDSGTFFTSGQDPIRKDILEMLFRMFDREGLTLVPGIAVSGPLPEVEQLRQRSANPDQFDLVNFGGETVRQSLQPDLPVYNPLNRTVQRSVIRIVEEISQRYSGHDSFQGMAVLCRPDCVTLLPGRRWCYDSMTIRQFLQNQPGVTLPTTVEQARQMVSSPEFLDKWIQWRADQMGSWYEAMLSEVQKVKPESKLYLAPVDLYRNAELVTALSPSLHSSFDFEMLMTQVGLEASQLSQHEGLELLQPNRIVPIDSLANRRVESHLEFEPGVIRYFEEAGNRGALFTHRFSWAHFAQLQAQNPFGLQQLPIMRLQQLTPAGRWNMQRFVKSLRDGDRRMLVDGGWMMAMGQEPDLREFLFQYAQLPNVEFKEVAPASVDRPSRTTTRPVVVRAAVVDGQTWFYAVNASPWRSRVHVTMSPGSNASLRSLGNSVMKQSNEGENLILVDLPPFGFATGVLDSTSDSPAELQACRFEVSPDIANSLRKRVFSLQAKLIRSTKVDPVPVLDNASFEMFEQPSLHGWDYGHQSTSRIRLKTSDAYQGNVSLVMENSEDQPVWIRSNTFEPVETGRLSLSVWLRTDTPSRQPPLRLSVEGRVGNRDYYRFGSVGSLAPDNASNQIGEQWQRFAVHFDDLPTENLSDLRIGFDLMGPGQVQVDQVEIYDRWFDENDAKAITQRLASCNPLLSDPSNFESCRQVLEGYWLRFLDEHFGDAAEPTTALAPRTRPAAEPDRNSVSPVKSKTWRFRGLNSSRR